MSLNRLVAAFVNRDWFENSIEAEQFKKRVESVWDGRIAPFCKTLRAIGLLANDVSVAGAGSWLKAIQSTISPPAPNQNVFLCHSPNEAPGSDDYSELWHRAHSSEIHT